MRITENNEVLLTMDEFLELIERKPNFTKPPSSPEPWEYHQIYKCKMCGNYHPPNMPCPNMMTWS